MLRLLKKCRSYFALTAACLWACLVVRAQNTATDYIVPPSPEATALGKYAQIPVGIYTGTPRIDIPIWEVKEGDLTLPISLSYHGAGYKVDEIAPRTGLGWTLNAGGVITRTVMGEADEYGVDGFLKFAENNTPLSVLQGTNEERFHRYGRLLGCGDAEPDHFAFNFNGHSGKFAFNWDRQIMVSSERQVKIEPVAMIPGANAFIQAWQVTVDDGTVYLFQAKETSRLTTTFDLLYPCYYIDDQSNKIDPVTSWYLTQITSPNGSKIFFEYQPYTFSHKIRVSETTSHKDGWSAANTESRTETITIQGQYLKKITASSGDTSIDFITGTTPRTDIPGTGTSAANTLFSLSYIKVFTGAGHSIRNFKLVYDYSAGRLTLKQLQESSGDDSLVKPPYQFFYQGSLPGFSSYAGTFFSQDHWGYFNGAVNSILTPPYLAVSAAGDTHLYEGAVRESNASAAVAGMLTKIKYPAGGTTEFQFESNDYSFLNTQPILESDILIRGPVIAHHSSEHSGATYESQRTVVGPFTLKPHPGNPSAYISLIYNIEMAYCSSGGLGGVNPRVTLRDANRVTVATWAHTPSNNRFYDTLDLPPGQYYLEAYAGPTSQCQDNTQNPPKLLGWDYAHASVTWFEYLPPARKDKIAGGTRIKKITDFDGIDPANNMVRTYEYKVDEGTAKPSSGVLPHLPRYQYDILVQEGTGFARYVVRYANSVIPLSMTQGSPVGYKKVAVFNGEGGTGGKTEYYYKTFGDPEVDRNDAVSTEPPFPPAASRDYKRGLLSKQLDYEYAGGTFRLVRQADHDYISNGGNIDVTTIFALKIGEKCIGCRLGNGPGRGMQLNWEYFSLGQYSFNLAISKLATTRETLFTDNGAFVTEKNYAYNAGLQWLMKEATTTSEGKTQISEYTYPSSYQNPPYPVSLLKERHILSPVVEKVTKEKSADATEWVTAASFTRFNVFNGNVLPDTLFQLLANAPLADFKPSAQNNGERDKQRYWPARIHRRYNAVGKLEEVVEPGQVITTYLWTPNSTWPVAQVNNARFGECAFTGFETTEKGNWQYADIPANRSSQARTGVSSFKDTVSLRGLSSGRYLLSLWAVAPGGSGSISVNGESRTLSGTWRRYEWITSDPAAIRVNPNGNLIDDLRLHPVTAQMKTYTYAPSHQVSSITDENHMTVFYEYDALGRLITIRDAEGNILKHYQYKYRENQ